MLNLSINLFFRIEETRNHFQDFLLLQRGLGIDVGLCRLRSPQRKKKKTYAKLEQ